MLDARRREGLTASEVAERVADGRSNSQRQPTSRSVRDILRENIFTLFNGILTACFVVVVLLGDLRDGFCGNCPFTTNQVTSSSGAYSGTPISSLVSASALVAASVCAR